MPDRRIRYAVVGLGHIAQVAVLPGFAHARRNSQLVAIVSGDRTKRRELARRYRLEQAFAYDEFDECLTQVDAVYIALPNSMHRSPRSSQASTPVMSRRSVSWGRKATCALIRRTSMPKDSSTH